MKSKIVQTSIRNRNRGGWSKEANDYLSKVQNILEELREYWPLTLRQVYYQLVASGVIGNNKSQYQKVSRVLVKARLDDLVPWDALEDRSRNVINSNTWSNSARFLEAYKRAIETGYSRDLMQSQASQLEIWIEKDALSAICQTAAAPYGTSVVVARGFSSVSFLHDLAERIKEKEKKTIVLYFGDLDPSGYEMLPTMLKTLQDEMGLGEMVQGVRCALTPDHVEKYNLPHNPDALKKSDTRAKRYVEEFGDIAVELDALSPKVLKSLIVGSIERYLDKSKFKREQRIEQGERQALVKVAKAIPSLVG